jgi:hypothetical protein
VRIEWAIPCRYAEVQGGMGTMVGAGANILLVAETPSAVGTMIVASIAGAEDEIGVEHTLKARVLGPDMEPATPTIEGKMGFASSPNKPAGWEERIMLPMPLQFVAPVEGTYTVELSINDRSATIPLLVQIDQ